MENKEILDYLKSVPCYSDEKELFYEEQMLQGEKYVPLRELVERFVEIDQYYHNSQWNIKQILANINIIRPLTQKEIADGTD